MQYFGKVSARVVPRVTGRARRNSSTDAAVLKRMALAGGAAPTAAHLSAARQAAQAVMESTVASAMKSLK